MIKTALQLTFLSLLLCSTSRANSILYQFTVADFLQQISANTQLVSACGASAQNCATYDITATAAVDGASKTFTYASSTDVSGWSTYKNPDFVVWRDTEADGAITFLTQVARTLSGTYTIDKIVSGTDTATQANLHTAQTGVLIAALAKTSSVLLSTSVEWSFRVTASIINNEGAMVTKATYGDFSLMQSGFADVPEPSTLGLVGLTALVGLIRLRAAAYTS
jgi:hypothetical protein